MVVTSDAILSSKIKLNQTQNRINFVAICAPALTNLFIYMGSIQDIIVGFLACRFRSLPQKIYKEWFLWELSQIIFPQLVPADSCQGIRKPNLVLSICKSDINNSALLLRNTFKVFWVQLLHQQNFKTPERMRRNPSFVKIMLKCCGLQNNPMDFLIKRSTLRKVLDNVS